MDASAIALRVDAVWDRDVLPTVESYIRIPNLSPMFDPQWQENGHIAAAVRLLQEWATTRPITGMSVTVEQIEGRTPVLVIEVAGNADGAGDVLLYGHLDKQPPMSGWREGLSAFEPVRDGERLYGRGGADDGYALFAALTAIESLQAMGGRHGRCVVLIEASEESGSPDLPAYVDALGPTIGDPELVICLDSGCATYDRLWLTTSLRGLVGLTVRVRVLDEGAHSGSAGGVVPSSFRLLRQLLSRIEDEATGELLVPELHVAVPPGREAEIVAAADELGDVAGGTFTLIAEKLHPKEPARQLRARTWEPAMAVVGMEGIPPVASAGNVLRPYTTVKLSFRVPPTCDPHAAAAALVRALRADPPHGAEVSVDADDIGPGWDSPPLAPWLAQAVDDASRAAFGETARAIGEGGSIPFMGMLGARFPDAQFVITGVLGPASNAHGPNEFLHVPMAKGVTTAVAHLLASHAAR
jgi:acetylornithine deacetylase/succinyl-diaminopimelate desuccinylase-like protein